jgi:shikimate dehydrogenase
MKRFALIGSPIDHSLSPLLHATIIEQLNIDASYEKIDVSPNQIKNFVMTNDYDGYNVTIPHKNTILDNLRYLDNNAKDITAVNCVHNHKGYNTDWIGFSDTLKKNKIDLKGKSCLIIGSGGAAYAIAFALIKNKVSSITIENRNRENKIKLEDWIAKRLKTITHIEPEVIINCTPLGMGQYKDKMPSKFKIRSKNIIIDTIYNPFKTRWLKYSEAKGAITISGLDMLISQAICSLNIWLNEDINSYINFKTIKTTLEKHLCLQK